MRWADRNWPDFPANKIHVTCAYEATSKVLGPPKTDLSVRDVDMVPTVRQALEALPSRTAGGLVFPRAGGAMFARSTMGWSWSETVTAAGVRPIRPYDLPHTFASLMIMAGKNPLYISRQMGHYSAGFTLGTYGHLMESVPRVQVEWIDELVFPEGWEAALISENAAPVSHPFSDFLRRPLVVAGRSSPRRQSRVAPRAEGPALYGRGSGRHGFTAPGSAGSLSCPGRIISSAVPLVYSPPPDNSSMEAMLARFSTPVDTRPSSYRVHVASGPDRAGLISTPLRAV